MKIKTAVSNCMQCEVVLSIVRWVESVTNRTCKNSALSGDGYYNYIKITVSINFIRKDYCNSKRVEYVYNIVMSKVS